MSTSEQEVTPRLCACGGECTRPRVRECNRCLYRRRAAKHKHYRDTHKIHLKLHRNSPEVKAIRRAKDKEYRDSLSPEEKAKKRAYVAGWRLTNPDKVRLRVAAWRLANSDKVKKDAKDWRLRNMERVRILQRHYVARDPLRARRLKMEDYWRHRPERLAKRRLLFLKEVKSLGNFYILQLMKQYNIKQPTNEDIENLRKSIQIKRSIGFFRALATASAIASSARAS